MSLQCTLFCMKWTWYSWLLVHRKHWLWSYQWFDYRICWFSDNYQYSSSIKNGHKCSRFRAVNWKIEANRYTFEFSTDMFEVPTGIRTPQCEIVIHKLHCAKDSINDQCISELASISNEERNPKCDRKASSSYNIWWNWLWQNHTSAKVHIRLLRTEQATMSIGMYTATTHGHQTSSSSSGTWTRRMCWWYGRIPSAIRKTNQKYFIDHLYDKVRKIKII